MKTQEMNLENLKEKSNMLDAININDYGEWECPKCKHIDFLTLQQKEVEIWYEMNNPEKWSIAPIIGPDDIITVFCKECWSELNLPNGNERQD